MKLRQLFIGIVFCLPGCDQSPPLQTDSAALTAREILADENVEGFMRATAARDFIFPQDHGRHDGFRNEWWYFTGNLTDDGGRRFGYQVTFFSTAVRPPASDENNAAASAWAGEHVWMGHAAVSDVMNRRHQAVELFSRENPGLAGAALEPFRVWIQDWRLSAAGNEYPWQLELDEDAFSLRLSLTPAKPPVRQGVNGLSRKSPEPGNGSYYYSLTRLETTGELTLAGNRYAVTGTSWLDREWSTSALAPDQSGWDWFSLQFADNNELMYYRLRTLAGESHPSSQGNWTNPAGEQTLIQEHEITLTETRTWRAPGGIVYATEWRMQYGDGDWIVRAVFEDQLMDMTFEYWEGAVDVLDAGTGEKVGQGYLEMVRDSG